MIAKIKVVSADSRDPNPYHISKTFKPQSVKPMIATMKPTILIFQTFVRRKIAQVLIFCAVPI
jgi:uncharacterized membrane protein (DUF106 family)